MKKTLNDRTLVGLKPAPAGKRYVVWDSVLPNFGIRVTEHGHKTFFVMRRLHGKLKRWNIGRFPVFEITGAREKAREFLQDISKGIDPSIKEYKQRREQEQRHNDTFEAVTKEFFKKHTSKLRRGKEFEAAIRRELYPRWGMLPISEITRRDVVAVLEEISDRGHAYAAHHLLSYIRKFFNWAIARDIYGLQASPCDRLKPSEVIGKKQVRQRVLNESDIFHVYAAAEKLGYPFGHMTLMLFITGQRLREVAEMSWSEVDLKNAIWTIPPERMKNDSSHIVPLSPIAVELLRSLPRWTKGDFVFSTTDGRRPISGFSKAKQSLDANVPKDALTEAWRFHDIRRTVRTNLSALPIEDVVRELVISHSKKGLHKIYDQWEYADEKRKALDLWAIRLKGFISSSLKNFTSNILQAA